MVTRPAEFSASVTVTVIVTQAHTDTRKKNKNCFLSSQTIFLKDVSNQRGWGDVEKKLNFLIKGGLEVLQFLTFSD